MPVKRRSSGPPNVERFVSLSEELGRELTSPKEDGQPLVDEETFPRTGLKGVTVIWDKWGGLTDPERTGVILDAYARASGAGEKDRIAFAVGLTVAEAAGAGMLPFTIVPSLRRTDPVTAEQVREVMRELGGNDPGAGLSPAELRFRSLDDAEACRRKLVERLPGSDDVWAIVHDAVTPSW